MTSPGRYRNEPADIIDQINRLTRRIEVLEANPRAGNTTIDAGSFRVRDATGAVQLQMGLLSDGTYGIEVKEAGQDNFHQMPYIYTNFVTSAAGDACSSSTYTDLATFGPRVVVPVRSSGRILVMGTAQIQWATPQAAFEEGDGRFDVEFVGANTRSPNEASDPLVGLVQLQTSVSTGAVGQAVIASVSAAAVFEGLNAGSTTITMKYRRTAAVTVDPTFFRRNLTVFSL